MISRSVLLRIRNVSDEVVEKIKTHFRFNTFLPKIILLKNMVEPGEATDDNITRRMRLA